MSNYTRQLKLQEIEEEAPSCRGVFKKAYRGRSLRAGVTAFCLNCMEYRRRAIRECGVSACPLHPYRPYQTVRK